MPRSTPKPQLRANFSDARITEIVMEDDPFLAAKSGRTRSWVGVNEEKPHAYLREAM